VRIARITRSTCAWTTALLIVSALHAQNTVLHITVVSGDGAIYTAGAHVTRPITIEVTDAAGQPVEGARASFQLPGEGPGGMFPSGLRTDLAITDASGRATLRGIELNRVDGPFTIRITAAKDLARAGIVVKQYVHDAKNAVQSADRKAPPARIANLAAVAPIIAASAPPQPKAAPEAAPGLTRSKPAGIPTIVFTGRTPRPVSQRAASSGHKSHKKWVWLGILAAGGAAGAFAGQNIGAAAAHGTGSAAASASGVSIGAPTITIGKP
jgi:hypothetical protein